MPDSHNAGSRSQFTGAEPSHAHAHQEAPIPDSLRSSGLRRLDCASRCHGEMNVGWASCVSPTYGAVFATENTEGEEDWLKTFSNGIADLRSPDERSESGIRHARFAQRWIALAIHRRQAFSNACAPEITDPGFAALIRATKTEFALRSLSAAQGFDKEARPIPIPSVFSVFSVAKKQHIHH